MPCSNDSVTVPDETLCRRMGCCYNPSTQPNCFYDTATPSMVIAVKATKAFSVVLVYLAVISLVSYNFISGKITTV